MSTCAIRPSIRLAILAAGCLLAGTTQAQVAEPNAPGRAEGLRYMSWAGRPQTTTPANVIAAQAEAEARAQVQVQQAQVQARPQRAVLPRRIAPTQAVSRPAMQPAPTPQPVSRGLTPASAWLAPQPTPSFAPGAPDPLAYTRDTGAFIAAADTMAPAAPLPIESAAPAPAAAPVETPPPPAADPMAPRPDALIFRLRPQVAAAPSGTVADASAPQRLAEAAAPVAAAPGQPTSRYYSVHRDAGRTPDHTPLPEAVFYDSVALDLAQPPESQTPQRDAQGRLRPPVREEDPERP